MVHAQKKYYCRGKVAATYRHEPTIYKLRNSWKNCNMVISGEVWTPTWVRVLSPYLLGNLCSVLYQEQPRRTVTKFLAMVPSRGRPGLWWERADEYRKIGPFQYLNFNNTCVGYTPTTKVQKEWVRIPSEALQLCLPKAKRLENSLRESIPHPQTHISQRWWSAGHHLHSVTVEGIPRNQLFWQKRNTQKTIQIYAYLHDLLIYWAQEGTHTARVSMITVATSALNDSLKSGNEIVFYICWCYNLILETSPEGRYYPHF